MRISAVPEDAAAVFVVVLVVEVFDALLIVVILPAQAVTVYPATTPTEIDVQASICPLLGSVTVLISLVALGVVLAGAGVLFVGLGRVVYPQTLEVGFR